MWFEISQVEGSDMLINLEYVESIGADPNGGTKFFYSALMGGECWRTGESFIAIRDRIKRGWMYLEQREEGLL